MKKNLLRFVRWFCRNLTYNDLASVIVVLHDVLCNARRDIQLKTDDRSPNYRNFRVDMVPPLRQPPQSKHVDDWQTIRRDYERTHNRKILPVKRKAGAKEPPVGCRCSHCNAPRGYLYMNNGKKNSQVRCKLCKGTSPTHRIRVESKVKYWCPYCGNALSKWKESSTSTIFKCFSYSCPHYQSNEKKLSAEEKQSRSELKYTPNYKLHYQHREHHFSPGDIKTARPDQRKSRVDLSRIHNNQHIVGLVLTFMVNLGLSSRLTRDALKGIFGIKLSHQACINYMNAAAANLTDLVDLKSPSPTGILAADETYIVVENEWHYTWFGIDSETLAICGYNLTNSRDTKSALSLLHDCYGAPDAPGDRSKLITDGNPSYDAALMAYNAEAEANAAITKCTVIGLENLDPTSTEYRRYKQLVERLNRTYKFHTRPRAGFKSFDGAVALTTLFVAYYNFMRPHSSLDSKPPVELESLKDVERMPQAWVELLRAAQ